MKLSIFYHHLCAWAQQKGQSIDSVLDTARSLGITHVEVDRDDIKDPQQFAALLAAHDLQVSSIYGFYDWVNHPDDFKDDLQLRQAVLLHCDKIMIIPGFYSVAACHDNTDHSSVNSKSLQKVREKLRNKLRSTGKSDGGSDLRAHEDHLMQGSMRQMIERAAALGLSVTIEDFDLNTSPICSSQGMLAMQQNAPGLRTTFDTGNFYYSGEPFGIPQPDDIIFLGWFSGGEVFRSGVTFTRGYGKIFYFQPGHEEQRIYGIPEIQRIIINAVRWTAPTLRLPAPPDNVHAV